VDDSCGQRMRFLVQYGRWNEFIQTAWKRADWVKFEN
jgi:hypothetical protein